MHSPFMQQALCKIAGLVLTVALSLAACGDGRDPASAPGPVPSQPLGSAPVSAPAPSPVGDGQMQKRAIQLGWDSPKPSYIKANIATMEQRPFSGTAVTLTVGPDIFRKTAYADSAFTQDRSDLASTAFNKFTENFVSIQSTPEGVWSWLDDGDWSAAQTNAANFAKTAKAGKFKGLFFDPEPYGNNLWRYTTALYPGKSFAQVQAKVRQRGASFMNAVQAENPNIKIMMLFGATIVKAQADEIGSLQDAPWTLWASFIDGMLDVIGPQAQLIDGNEGSYYYTDAKYFYDFQDYNRSARALMSPENRVKYDHQVRTARAVFVDGTLDTWRTSRFIGHYFGSDADRSRWLEYTVYHALRSSDEYAWIYGERMDWWGSKGNGVQLPDGVETILVRAVRQANANEPLSFTLSPEMSAAIATFEGRRYISGQIKNANGQGVSGTTISASGIAGAGMGNLGDVYCGTPDSDGHYGCYFPRNASYTITPSKSGVSFNPSSRSYGISTNPSSQENRLDQDFVSTPIR